MRPFELVLVILLPSAAILESALLRLNRVQWCRCVFFLACAVVGTHLFVEGWRLQMVSLYLAVFPLALIAYGRIGIMGLSASTAGVVLCSAVGGVAAYAFPVFVLPEPQGPYKVGTIIHYLVDQSRHERHASSPLARRELMIQIWYPAKQMPGVRAWYRDPRMNTWRSQHLQLVKTHSYWSLPVADQPHQFPVILFSPSSGGFRSQNTFEIEELASQGYVVVGIDHPYSGSRVVFPDGRMAHSLPWVDTSNPATLNASTRLVEMMVEDHAADARFILDEMSQWNLPGSKHLLAGRLGLTRVGVIGHSFGGALAAAACISDRRVVAGINMDGWMFGEAERTGIPKPFLFMNSEETLESLTVSGAPDLSTERDREHLQVIQESLKRYGGYNLTVQGAHHVNYSDLVLFRRAITFGRHELDPYRVFHIVNAFTLAFFDRYLRDRPARLLNEGGFLSEVQYEVFPAPPATEAAAKPFDPL